MPPLTIRFVLLFAVIRIKQVTQLAEFKTDEFID
ncbi:hypothetical protein BV97_04903 [Novosphingobium resinovorum]|jgi:hypothetical protein|uniref:Uncharacterized protein n=1 Tax=Novosphingobium resinovorum TaxID=158500 RepID=A0A031JMG7_9SPHN|nr:hypothetical protein BV97_04903 [Novosphingobium resinovorum]